MLLEGNLRGVQHLGIPVIDLETSKAWYVEKLGFRVAHEPRFSTPEGEIRVAFLERDGLVLECYQLVGLAYQEIRRRGHGHIDHFALDVLDIDTALAEAQQKGAVLEESTAQGPVFLPQFWSQGAKYVFLRGPNGEKVELNQRLDLPQTRRAANLGGWSHLGIPVVDLESARAFYTRFGFETVMNAAIPVEGDEVRAAMLEKDGFLLEFYQLAGADLEAIRARGDGHIDHIALDVQDIDGAFAELKAAGMTTLEPAPVALPFWERGIKYFNIRGPNGEKVEFNQRLG